MNDVQVVVVVAKGAVETVVVHFGQDELEEEGECVRENTPALAFLSLLAPSFIFTEGVSILPLFINVSAPLLLQPPG